MTNRSSREWGKPVVSQAPSCVPSRQHCGEGPTGARSSRSRFPPWVLSSFPDEPEELKTAAAAWLRDHAGQLSSTGQNLWRGLIHVLFGMVIGGMVAVSREAGDIERGPLAEALGERARATYSGRLSEASHLHRCGLRR